MKWRAVASVECVGTASHMGKAVRDRPANIYRVHLTCGHHAMLTAHAAPVQIECTMCADAAVQLLLPLRLPHDAGRKM